ncbi:MAG: hypothetical protein LBI82_06680 [Dysgonamonadaceae bacterium]|jgi:hypothetical protein|nr:hypothetical protein [Dysgonamonadaceae bacterium]
MNKTNINIFATIVLAFLLSACSKPGNNFLNVEQTANIHPVYQGTIIPYNIAPLNFMIREEGSHFMVRFVAGKDSFDVSCRNGKISIPLKKWEKLLETHRGEQMDVNIFVKKVSGWERYTPLKFTIANEPIDSWLAYRLIEPGYERWNNMGIYQRCLENFNEKPIMLNRLTDGNCMNCHSFCKNDPQTMLFHIRARHSGTLFVKDGKVSKVDTKAPEMISAGVYPRWHPDGRYVAFSVNNTMQGFHTTNENKVEVYDDASDLILFDTQNNTITTNRLISSQSHFETFPEWSPDGEYLYFCSAEALKMPQEYDSLRYDLMRIAFDVSSGSFGSQIETVLSSKDTGKSITLARISPDGKYVVFCMSDFGAFPVWHRETDLYIMDLETKEIRNLSAINSDQSESYHSWSSNGRWMVFGSRRMDGSFTRPYICYFDTEGNAHTPFILPQKDPQHYDFFIKSYNIPEFITGKVLVSPYKFAETAKGKAAKVR